jgi:hypothetical protein
MIARNAFETARLHQTRCNASPIPTGTVCGVVLLFVQAADATAHLSNQQMLGTRDMSSFPLLRRSNI